MSRGLQGPRAQLNELKWHHDALDEAVVHYVHRGAPGDRAVIEGADILELGRSFITLRTPEGEGQIPYHRVFRIDRGQETIWERSQMHEDQGDELEEGTGTRADRA